MRPRIFCNFCINLLPRNIAVLDKLDAFRGIASGDTLSIEHLRQLGNIAERFLPLIVQNPTSLFDSTELLHLLLFVILHIFDAEIMQFLLKCRLLCNQIRLLESAFRRNHFFPDLKTIRNEAMLLIDTTEQILSDSILHLRGEDKAVDLTIVISLDDFVQSLDLVDEGLLLQKFLPDGTLLPTYHGQNMSSSRSAVAFLHELNK